MTTPSVSSVTATAVTRAYASPLSGTPYIIVPVNGMSSRFTGNQIPVKDGETVYLDAGLRAGGGSRLSHGTMRGNSVRFNLPTRFLADVGQWYEYMHVYTQTGYPWIFCPKTRSDKVGCSRIQID